MIPTHTSDIDARGGCTCKRTIFHRYGGYVEIVQSNIAAAVDKLANDLAGGLASYPSIIPRRQSQSPRGESARRADRHGAPHQRSAMS